MTIDRLVAERQAVIVRCVRLRATNAWKGFACNLLCIRGSTRESQATAIVLSRRVYRRLLSGRREKAKSLEQEVSRHLKAVLRDFFDKSEMSLTREL